MNQDLFILNDDYSSIINRNKSIKIIKELKQDTDILIGNCLFKIFNFNLEIDDGDFEIFSISNKKKILNILKMTENHICYYNNNFYITEQFKSILDLIIKNNFSNEYNQFLLNSMIKKNHDIYYFIDKLDIVNFNKVYTSQFDIIKYINNLPYYPINYCMYMIHKYKNNIAREVLINMFNLLKNFDYDIHPKILDNNYENYEEINISKFNEASNLHDLLNICLEKHEYSFFARCITVFKLNYTNSDFIYLIKNRVNDINEIIKNIKEKDVYNHKDFLELLLILNQVNEFHNCEYKNDNLVIDFNTLIFYLNKYNSNVSFYYILDNYFDKIQIKDILSIDFIKIYLYFVVKKTNANDIILNYLNIILEKNNTCVNLEKILDLLINCLNKNEVKLEHISIIIYKLINHQNNLKHLLKLNENIKYIIKDIDFIKSIIENKDEDLFYFIQNLFSKDEFNKILSDIKDNDGNTIYHLICKNNICLGYHINNKVRNNKGFKPLDMCLISSKYYKV